MSLNTPNLQAARVDESVDECPPTEEKSEEREGEQHFLDGPPEVMDVDEKPAETPMEEAER